MFACPPSDPYPLLLLSLLPSALCHARILRILLVDPLIFFEIVSLPSIFALREDKTRMPLKAIAFDWGHTLMDERRDGHIPLDTRPIHLMPDVVDVLPQLTLPLAVWANTHVDGEPTVRGWLDRAGLGQLFQWVITSVDAGARKPLPEFFRYALAHCGLTKDSVLFVGNQLNTDIAGGEAFGVRTVWLSGAAYRSLDDGPCSATATYTIDTLSSLPTLVQNLQAS
jgi:beta-phosphoglucomutase-like phosphatase (HAD superfamily)